METKDFSKEIYEKYYSSKDRILEITFKDDTVLIGKFISFFHEATDSDEPLIIKWHFIDESEISKTPISITEDNGFGKVIKQEDIKTIKFRI